MANNKVSRFSVKPQKQPSEAQLRGEYVVPPERQQLLRDLHARGREIERELGSLRVQYLLAEGRLMQELQENARRYETQVKEAAATGELDFTQPWDFELQTMTFRRHGGPLPEAAVPAAPPPQPAANSV